jgi:hypothetical protein
MRSITFVLAVLGASAPTAALSWQEYEGGIKYQVQRLKKLVDAPCFSSAF